jgi:hypothetical protein
MMTAMAALSVEFGVKNKTLTQNAIEVPSSLWYKTRRSAAMLAEYPDLQVLLNDTHVPQLGAWVPRESRVGRQGTWRPNPIFYGAIHE